MNYSRFKRYYRSRRSQSCESRASRIIVLDDDQLHRDAVWFKVEVIAVYQNLWTAAREICRQKLPFAKITGEKRAIIQAKRIEMEKRTKLDWELGLFGPNSLVAFMKFKPV